MNVELDLDLDPVVTHHHNHRCAVRFGLIVALFIDVLLVNGFNEEWCRAVDGTDLDAAANDSGRLVGAVAVRGVARVERARTLATT